MLVIAKNTVKEFIRNKIVYLIIWLSVWLIFLSIVLSKLALSEEQKIILDFSLSVIEIFWLITTLFLWTNLLYNEISKNTILLILSKNNSRKDFLIWKYLWFVFVILLLYIIMSVAFLLVLMIHNIPFHSYFFFAIFLSFIKIIVVLAFIICFSTFISPIVTLFLTLGIYFISHMTAFLKFYTIASKKIEKWSIAEIIVNLIYYIFPNFHDLSMKEYLMSPYLWEYTIAHISLSTLSSLWYIIVLLFVAIIVFKRKEF